MISFFQIYFHSCLPLSFFHTPVSYTHLVQDRFDVVLTIEGGCQVINGRYYMNKSDEISVNHEKKSFTKYCKFTGTVIGIGE